MSIKVSGAMKPCESLQHRHRVRIQRARKRARAAGFWAVGAKLYGRTVGERFWVLLVKGHRRERGSCAWPVYAEIEEIQQAKIIRAMCGGGAKV